MSQAPQLIVHHDLADFFREEIVHAKKQLQVHVDGMVEYYLVNLLTSFSYRHDMMYALRQQPLFLLQRQASEAPAAEQVALLKQLGDEALYVSGFFAESVECSMVDGAYYAHMGSSAYQQLSDLVATGHHKEVLHGLYGQLSQKFCTLVDLLNQVSSRSQQREGNDRFLLKLYDRYTKTRNQRVKKMLEGRGLLVFDTSQSAAGH